MENKQEPSLNDIRIRPLEERDNAVLAQIIRSTLVEFGANHPGTVYYDEETDRLHSVFSAAPRSAYFVAEKDGALLGGGGIYPTAGLPEDTCELVKMYLLPEGRGLGLGRKLIELCISTAKEKGFTRIYLETMPELKLALNAYAKLGFRYLDGPMGSSGHFGCELWMLKEL